jgi:hypothetical protein
MGKTADQTNALSAQAIEGGAECMGRLADSFEASARRWELIVYPSLIAFILLAAYGFFLIYNLTHDISDVAKSVHIMTESVTEDLGQIAESTSYMRPMSEDMRAMSGSINEMNTNVSHMQYNMWQLNRNVSAPFNMVEKMMPFGSSRPYGRSHSRITRPIYPRKPTVYAPQPVMYSPPAQTIPVNQAASAKVAYSYYPYGYAVPIKRF